MHRVLVVGDSTQAMSLARGLGLLGFEATASASETPLALRQLFAFRPDAVVFDGCSEDQGRQLFSLLNKVCPLPITVLGDSQSEEEMVWYLEEGATYYLVKPISPNHLAARLRAALRRTTQQSPDTVVRVGDLEIDPDRQEVRRQGQVIPLTPTEFRLLRALAERPGQACSYRMLLERVWGEDFAHCAHYLRLYIGYLRQKLEDDPKRPRLLVTQWGVGYRLQDGRPKGALPRLRSARTALA